MRTKMKRGTTGIYRTAEDDYAIMNDCRNWWIITPIIDGEIEYGSMKNIYINGTYSDAVRHLDSIRAAAKAGI